MGSIAQFISEDAPMAPGGGGGGRASSKMCMTKDRSNHLCEGHGVVWAPGHEAGGQARDQRCKHQLIGQHSQPRLRGGRRNFASCGTVCCNAT